MLTVRHRLALLLAGFVATHVSAQTYTRIPASEFVKDPAKVAALQKAVAAMKARNNATPTTAEFRTSWTYWAATHGYLGTGKNASTTAAKFKAGAPKRCNNDPVCISYYDHVGDLTPPNDGITGNVWGTCQHTSGKFPNLQFLPWHRMYLIYYERTLRAASGDPNFALPYWDYYDEMGPKNGVAIPRLVRGAAAQSLYDQFRTPGLNDNTTSIDPAWATAHQAFDFNDFMMFSRKLEQQPHGMMHCGTGFNCQAPDMGIVPVAGLDPVFYMHHANIDRLWQCWMLQQSKGQPITLQWAQQNLGVSADWFEQRWYFVDENGASVSMQVKDLFAPGVVNYTYANYDDCAKQPPAPPTTAMMKAAPAPPPPDAVTTPARAAVASRATTLRGRAVTVPLTRAAADPALPQGVRLAAGRTMLIIQDVRFDGHPGVTYDIFIAPRKAPSRRMYIASFNLFGVLDHDHGGGPGHDLLFWDITNELARLALTPASDLVVVFEPNHGRENQPVTAAQAAGAVTVGSITVQTGQ